MFNVDLYTEETQEMCAQWQLHKAGSADTCITFKYQQQLQSRGNAWGSGTFVSHVCCQHEHTQMQGHSHWHIHTAGLCLPHAADKPQLFSLPPSVFAHCLLPFVALSFVWCKQLIVANDSCSWGDNEKDHIKWQMMRWSGWINVCACVDKEPTKWFSSHPRGHWKVVQTGFSQICKHNWSNS